MRRAWVECCKYFFWQCLSVLVMAIAGKKKGLSKIPTCGRDADMTDNHGKGDQKQRLFSAHFRDWVVVQAICC